ncbi:hypothetical protein ACFFQF_23540 [Haladaptatus pallidirubidus]|nr:hypothetical protein [Haladaptatus pallidirubidus]
MLSKRFLNDSCTSTSLALLHPGGTRILGVFLTTDAEQDVEACDCSERAP